jgi:hypothetical protein
MVSPSVPALSSGLLPHGLLVLFLQQLATGDRDAAAFRFLPRLLVEHLGELVCEGLWHQCHQLCAISWRSVSSR